MLLGRTRELDILNKLYASDKFELVIISGRRRVGKSALIQEFAAGKNSLFFSAEEITLSRNIQSLFAAIAPDASIPPEEDHIRGIFEVMRNSSEHERLILIIDNYDFLSLPRSAIDEILKKLSQADYAENLMAVLVFSSTLTFNRNFPYGKSDLTALSCTAMQLAPLDYFDVREYFFARSDEECAAIYAVTGGVPYYFRMFSDGKTIYECALEYILSDSAWLRDEPQNLLRTEVREVVYYNSILLAIASGKTKVAEIAGSVGLKTSALSAYLGKLVQMGYVDKIRPALGASVRKTIYRISDGFFRFWFTFAPKYLNVRNNMKSRDFSHAMEAFMHQAFVEICRSWLKSGRSSPPEPAELSSGVVREPPELRNELDSFREWMLREQKGGVTSDPVPRKDTPIKLRAAKNTPDKEPPLGEWWGNLSGQAEEIKIDIVSSQAPAKIIFGNCVWSDEKAQMSDLQPLLDASDYLGQGAAECYLFSKSGFSGECIRISKDLDNVNLILFETISNT